MNVFAGIALAVTAIAVPASADLVKPAAHVVPDATTGAVCTTDLDCARWSITHGVPTDDLPAEAVQTAYEELGLMGT